MKRSFLPAILLCFICLNAAVNAQTLPALPEPYQEKLLNGLKVLVWNDPKTDKVTLKVRVHAGSMFDPKDKTGVMRLLAEILFPDPQTRAYFREDLEGDLSVTSNYDYIEVRATGKADEFVNILDSVRIGIVTTPITQENFVKVREELLARIREDSAKPEVIADHAVARRLLGDFPYGRPMDGTPESLAKIDRFDLVTAKEKFLDADNATLAIYGRIEPRFAVRAVKQMLGNWQKSEGIVPPTFAQPDPAETKPLVIDTPGAANAEIRFAVRGLASNDKDTPALIFWVSGFEKKINAALPADCTGGVKVSHWSHILPGYLLVSGSFPADSAGKCYKAVSDQLTAADAAKIKPEDFTETHSIINGAVTGKTDHDSVSNLWLNADTFKWGKYTDQLKLMNAATAADGDRVASRVFGKAPIAGVAVGDAARIKPQFAAGTVFGTTPEQELAIKKEIVGFLTAWKDTQEKRDMDAHLKLYGEKLEFFGKDANKGQEEVRAERQKEWADYDALVFRIDKIGMKVESDSLVYVLFDRNWVFRNKAGASKGALQQEMKLVKNAGSWQIVADKTIQTYFAEKEVNNAKPAATPATKPE